MWGVPGHQGRQPVVAWHPLQPGVQPAPPLCCSLRWFASSGALESSAGIASSSELVVYNVPGGLRELTAGRNLHQRLRGTRITAKGLHLAQDIHPLDHLPEDHMPAVQPWGRLRRHEELGAIGVGAAVGHGQDTRAGVLQCKGLVCEGAAVDGATTGAVVVGEVPTLGHEARDDPVEAGAPVAKALLAGNQLAEVLGRLGGDVGPQLHLDPPKGGTSSGHLKVDNRV
mmetsp:Transcript_11092/g.19888  ORF Transcript_11092/g.19888 Transcript_11092/m.19888 type:complete len:227 (+) Transcript_11092:225-905(+)